MQERLVALAKFDATSSHQVHQVKEESSIVVTEEENDGKVSLLHSPITPTTSVIDPTEQERNEEDEERVEESSSILIESETMLVNDLGQSQENVALLGSEIQDFKEQVLATKMSHHDTMLRLMQCGGTDEQPEKCDSQEVDVTDDANSVNDNEKGFEGTALQWSPIKNKEGNGNRLAIDTSDQEYPDETSKAGRPVNENSSGTIDNKVTSPTSMEQHKGSKLRSDQKVDKNGDVHICEKIMELTNENSTLQAKLSSAEAKAEHVSEVGTLLQKMESSAIHLEGKIATMQKEIECLRGNTSLRITKCDTENAPEKLLRGTDNDSEKLWNDIAQQTELEDIEDRLRAKDLIIAALGESLEEAETKVDIMNEKYGCDAYEISKGSDHESMEKCHRAENDQLIKRIDDLEQTNEKLRAEPQSMRKKLKQVCHTIDSSMVGKTVNQTVLQSVRSEIACIIRLDREEESSQNEECGDFVTDGSQSTLNALDGESNAIQQSEQRNGILSEELEVLKVQLKDSDDKVRQLEDDKNQICIAHQSPNENTQKKSADVHKIKSAVELELRNEISSLQDSHKPLSETLKERDAAIEVLQNKLDDALKEKLSLCDKLEQKERDLDMVMVLPQEGPNLVEETKKVEGRFDHHEEQNPTPTCGNDESDGQLENTLNHGEERNPTPTCGNDEPDCQDSVDTVQQKHCPIDHLTLETKIEARRSHVAAKEFSDASAGILEGSQPSLGNGDHTESSIVQEGHIEIGKGSTSATEKELKKRIASLHKSIKGSNETVQKKDVQIRTLQGELEEKCRATLSVCDKMTQHVSDLDKDMEGEDFAEQKSKLDKEISAMKDTLARVKYQMDSANFNMVHFEEENADRADLCTQSCKDLKKEMDATRMAKDELEARMKKEIQSLERLCQMAAKRQESNDTLIESIQKDLEKAQETCSARGNKMAEQERELWRLLDEKNSLHEQNVSLSETANTLRRNLDESNAMLKGSNSLNRNIRQKDINREREHMALIESLREELHDANNIREELESELKKQVQKDINREREHMALIESLRKELQDANNIREELESEFKKQVQDLQHSRLAEAKMLKRMLKKRKATIESLEKVSALHEQTMTLHRPNLIQQGNQYESVQVYRGEEARCLQLQDRDMSKAIESSQLLASEIEDLRSKLFSTEEKGSRVIKDMFLKESELVFNHVAQAGTSTSGVNSDGGSEFYVKQNESTMGNQLRTSELQLDRKISDCTRQINEKQAVVIVQEKSMISKSMQMTSAAPETQSAYEEELAALWRENQELQHTLALVSHKFQEKETALRHQLCLIEAQKDEVIQDLQVELRNCNATIVSLEGLIVSTQRKEQNEVASVLSKNDQLEKELVVSTDRIAAQGKDLKLLMSDLHNARSSNERLRMQIASLKSKMSTQQEKEDEASVS